MKIFVVRYTNPTMNFTNVLNKGYASLEEAKAAVSKFAHDYLAVCVESDPVGHVYTIDTESEVFLSRYVIVRTSNCGSVSHDIAEYSLVEIDVDL